MIKTAVILAAGRGTRLRPYTHDIPKGFMQVGDERLIERSVRLLKENGIETIIIGTGHLKEHYESFAKAEGLKTFVNPDFSSTGSFHTLYCGQDLIMQDFLLLESDLLYEEKAIKTLLRNGHSDVILCSGFTQSNDEVYVEITDGWLTNLSKKKEALKSVDAELVGIWKISHSLYQKLLTHHKEANDANIKDYERAIADLNQPSVFAEIIGDLVWCEIDNEEHLERANEKILPKLL